MSPTQPKQDQKPSQDKGESQHQKGKSTETPQRQNRPQEHKK